MKRQLFQGENQEQVISFFALWIKRSYYEYLTQMQTDARASLSDFMYWNMKIQNKFPEKLRKESSKKLYKIIKRRSLFSFLKIFCIINISVESGFFDNLLEKEDSLKTVFPSTYQIDISKYTILEICEGTNSATS